MVPLNKMAMRGCCTPQHTVSYTAALPAEKSIVFFTKHEACASNVMFTLNPFGSGKKKTCLFKNKPNKKISPGQHNCFPELRANSVKLPSWSACVVGLWGEQVGAQRQQSGPRPALALAPVLCKA